MYYSSKSVAVIFEFLVNIPAAEKPGPRYHPQTVDQMNSIRGIIEDLFIATDQGYI